MDPEAHMFDSYRKRMVDSLVGIIFNLYERGKILKMGEIYTCMNGTVLHSLIGIIIVCYCNKERVLGRSLLCKIERQFKTLHGLSISCQWDNYIRIKIVI